MVELCPAARRPTAQMYRAAGPKRQPKITPWEEGCGQAMDPPPSHAGSAPGVGVARGGSCWMEPFLAQPQPCRSLAYSLVNVHCHGQVVPGKDRRVVVEAALGTDVELRAPGSRKEM